MSEEFEVRLKSEHIDKFLTQALEKSEKLGIEFATEEIITIATEIEELVLAAILDEHPIGQFMYERTRIQMIPSPSMVTLKISGRPENELVSDIKKSSKTYNLWAVHEFGSGGGNPINAKPGHPIPIIKDKGSPPQSFRMSASSHPINKYQGIVRQIVNNLIPQLEARFIQYITSDAIEYVAKFLESTTGERIDISKTKPGFGGWMAENNISVDELTSSGIVRIGSYLQTTKSGEVFQHVYAQNALASFTNIPTRSNIKWKY